jgi:hypothetical protein
MIPMQDDWFSLLILKILSLYFAAASHKGNIQQDEKYLTVFLQAIQKILQSQNTETMLCVLQFLTFLLQHHASFRSYLFKQHQEFTYM